MKKLVQITCLIILFLILVAIRAVAISYFYDPLIQYFKGDHNYMAMPELDFLKYYFFLLLRYCLNGIVSLAIIYVLFPNLKLLFFTVKFYILAFVFLGVLLFGLLKFDLFDNYLITFYVRRFLIHPLFLLILLPAFYYQKLNKKEENSL